MRTLLLLLLWPVLGFGQVSQDSIAGTSFILKDQDIIFKKVYVSDLNQEALSDKLYNLLSVTKGFRFNTVGYQVGTELVGRLINHTYDLNKYGYSTFGTPIMLGLPTDAIVIIQVKDYKYQVILSAITFKDFRSSEKEKGRDFLLDDYVTKKNRTKIVQSKSNVKLAKLLNTDFANLFDLKKSNLISEF